MRDKEAIEAERKNLARTLEKQGKAVDHFTELEKQLETQKVAVSISVHGNLIYEISFPDYPWKRFNIFQKKQWYV